jgi:hypothetical protein
MPVSVHCPGCGSAARVPDTFLGQPVRCKKCRRKFTAAADRPAPTAGDEATRSSPRAASASSPAAVPTRVGRFEVRSVLGQGAFGTVYRAYDPQLEREVALKVPLPGALDGPRAAERFLREARAAAGLRHPHLVPVYDAGRGADGPYIASAFVAGHTLARALDGGPLEPQRAARVVRGLAEALAYAHRCGVVHRDVKPANVMLDAADAPHLMDFGLAVSAESSAKITRDGAVLGTPSYMAPEQAGGQQGEARPAADQYSLGVVLYEQLAGRPPFEGPAPALLYHAIHTEPPPPRTFRPGIPADLETVCLKAMAKRPEDRYADCQDLADDLRRFLEGEPVRARRLSARERLGRWLGRNPGLARAATVTAACLVLLALVGGAGSAVMGELSRREDEARRHAEEARAAAAEARQKADESREAAAAVGEEIERDNEKAAEALRQAEASRRQAEESRRKAREQRQEEEKLLDDAKDADRAIEEAKAKAGKAGQAEEEELRKVRFAETKARFARMRQPTSRGLDWTEGAPGFPGALSPDGTTVAHVGISNGEPALWRKSLPGHGPPKPSASAKLDTERAKVTFSADGKRLLVTWGLVLTEWDVERWLSTRFVSVKGPYETVLVTPSPDFGRVAVLDAKNKSVRVWDGFLRGQRENGYGNPGDKLLSDWKSDVAVHGMLFSPDGTRLALALGDRIEVRDADTGKVVCTVAVAAAAEGVPYHFSPDGKQVAFVAAGPDRNTLALADAATGKVTGVRLVGHERPITAAAFSPDGQFLATGAADGVIKVWVVATGECLRTLEGSAAVQAIAVASDGRRLVAVTRDRRAYVWE